MHIKAGDPGAKFVSVFDGETGEKLQRVVEVNDTEGWYRAYAAGPDGRVLRDGEEAVIERVDRPIRIEVPEQYRHLFQA
ncbi:hypothetical protein [Azospirillum sp. B510]|uniref:hypothetical protein n=1 Tax=Azospirillum sp. (strain B510) TaxID=137722 RepID=UPI0002FB038B|nr:hypothetical protein [Azospirillum sp. B510]